MEIIILCYEYPSPSTAGSHRVLYSLEHLSQKYRHDITLVAFKLPGKDYPDLSRYCRVETIDIPDRPGLNSLNAMLNIFNSAFSLRHLLAGNTAFLNYSYSREMERKIESLLADNNYDIIAVDHPAMLRYVSAGSIPVVLLEAFALAEITRMEYNFERNWPRKIARLLYYYQTRNYGDIYKKLDTAIAVSNHQRDTVRSHCPRLNIEVIPYGIDTDYFRVVEAETDFPSLIITGQMSGSRNRAAVLYFYDKIYPLIKMQVPQLRLYIVGSNPDREILQLAIDESVIVTGYVPDLRPYLSRAWVVAAPLREGLGVKVRVLQAMAVGKPVVATSLVTTGMNVSPGENIIIADEPVEFASKVIELLNDRQLRENIGDRARLLMETEHSWENLTDRLNEVLERTITKKLPVQDKAI
ncbi:MAG: glycosyltransferase [Dehalococcoidales bacterium]|nr:glycosyltransferase [Dehalococcoidales bacterium]